MSLLNAARTAATVFLLWATVWVAGAQEVFSPEALYQQTVETWQRNHSRRSPTSWEVWKDFAKRITFEYETIILIGKDGTAPTAAGPSSVEIVGAIEEGILTIERIIFQQEEEGSGNAVEDRSRDASLAVMYREYGRLLLYSSETITNTDTIKTTSTTTIASATHRCYDLAKDPHTLLIGAPERVNEYLKKKDSKNKSSNTDLLASLFGPLCRDNAENALRNALTLDASCTEAETLLDVISSGDIAHTRKPKEFVAELFDSFADTFDEQLTKGLEYRVPQIIGSKVEEILEKEGKKSVRNVLDAGCGTGLAGRELRKVIDGPDASDRITLVGVDASPKMLEIAKLCTATKGCGLPTVGGDSTRTSNNNPKLYNALIDLDLEEITLENTLGQQQQVSGFDLIVAADVFVYFGSLERILEVFSGLHKKQEGILVFTCERVTPEQAPLGFNLMPTGRFAHTKDHVLNAASASGYSILDYSEIVPRMEKGSAVDGHLFVFSHTTTRKGDSANGSEGEL